MYVDAHATTPCDPAVVEAMAPYWTATFGNAASGQHRYGWAANEAVETARAHVAALVGARLRDVVFTSGATEADNLALKGVADGCGDRDIEIVTVATEHTAVLDPCRWLAEQRGVTVRYLPVDAQGLVTAAALETALTPRTRLVSVMAANNEIGVLQPLAALAAAAHRAGAWFHTDAAQATGTVAIDMDAMGIDLLSCTAHKMYGPKGVGALVVRRKSKVPLAPLHHGGGHERGLRSGTLNVPAIVGFGEAARLARARRAADADRLGALRDRLWTALQAIGGIHLNGASEPRLPHNLNVRIDGARSRDLILALDDVAVSPGAACASTSAEPSYVLQALGLSAEQALSSLRFGLLRTMTESEVDVLAARVAAAVAAARAEAARLR